MHIKVMNNMIEKKNNHWNVVDKVNCIRIIYTISLYTYPLPECK